MIAADSIQEEFINNMYTETNNICHYDKLQKLLPRLAISESFCLHLLQRTVAFKDPWTVNKTKSFNLYRMNYPQICGRNRARPKFRGTGPIFIVVRHGAHRCSHCNDFFSFSFIIWFLLPILMVCIKYWVVLFSFIGSALSRTEQVSRNPFALN